MQKKRILFIYSNFSSFVEKDYELLNTVYKVDQYRFRAIKGLPGTAMEITRQFIFLILNIWKYDAVFVWFADYHTLLPVVFAKLLHKKSFIVIGGYDVSYLPEYNYGSFNRPLRKFFATNSLRKATICFPVAEALNEKIKIISPQSRVEVLPTFTDSSQFDFVNNNRSKIVITVASADSYQRAMIKGLDRFRELALTMPDFEFVIIGINKTFESFFIPIPENLKFESSVLYSDLPGYYNKASFYAQFSRSEGLPNSLCEAMLCGCIPLGTNVGDIKPTINGIGLVLNDWNAGIIPDFIRNNHNNNELRGYSRSRIMEKYDPEIRIKRLTNLI